MRFYVLVILGWVMDSACVWAAEPPQRESLFVAARKSQHWCWQPLRRPAVPAVQHSDWPMNAVDRFVVSELEKLGAQPPPTVRPLLWLRRVSFDLIGLPPTLEEIAAFERDCAEKGELTARARVVDRLLSRPQFGERWARHWLDLVRYAETKGHEFDAIIPNAYQYRDYVIRAFQDDIPYNQFVLEHVAGDLLTAPRINSHGNWNESILATGFWFLGEEVHSPVDIRADEYDRMDNQIDVFSKTFLGLTVSCARCHDHKFDAISQRDYYALRGLLLSSSYRQVRFDTQPIHERIQCELRALRESHRVSVLQSFAHVFRPFGASLADHLLNARAAVRSGGKGETPLGDRWVAYLVRVRDEPGDPFHLWAQVCSKDDNQVGAFLAGWFRRAEAKTADLVPPGSPFWKSDGPAFVAQPGILWNTRTEKPIFGFVNAGEFHRDRFWNGLKVAPGTETDPGALGRGPSRYGYLLRSVKFELQSPRVWVRVKGRGRLYAAVDSHKLIEGPLHGSLVRDFDTLGVWRWVGVDLRNYIGHRLHLEAWPTNEADFAVGEIRLSSEEPSIVPQGIAALVEHGVPQTAEELAQVYQDWFKRVLDALSRGDDRSPEVTTLANVLCQQPELFGGKDMLPLQEAAQPVIRKMEQMAQVVPRESRLAPAIWDFNGIDDHVHPRGAAAARGRPAPRRFLEALVGEEPLKSVNSGRLELAHQLVDPHRNPLIARVLVNRVWHHLFGQGIVPSTDNFGVLGDPPRHRELLDYLADWFVHEGEWSIKKLIRELVLSQTYCAKSNDDSTGPIQGPRLKRLDGETIRDAMLFVSGRLDAKSFGSPVPIYLGNIPQGRGRPQVDGPLDGAGRRSIYIAVRRNFLSPWMLAFDTPAPFSTIGRRAKSNVPSQALILLNDPLVHELAQHWGRALAMQAGHLRERIGAIYLSALTRPPTDVELDLACRFIEERGSARPESWAALAHVLWNVKEFIFVP